jgi:phosphoglycolate phosphatase-like HAD superfamily hydrolase
MTEMQNYRLAVFDFDGTLAGTFPFFLSVFNLDLRQDLAHPQGARAGTSDGECFATPADLVRIAGLATAPAGAR